MHSKYWLAVLLACPLTLGGCRSGSMAPRPAVPPSFGQTSPPAAPKSYAAMPSPGMPGGQSNAASGPMSAVGTGAMTASSAGAVIPASYQAAASGSLSDAPVVYDEAMIYDPANPQAPFPRVPAEYPVYGPPGYSAGFGPPGYGPPAYGPPVANQSIYPTAAVGPHGSACPCCRSRYGEYQPVYSTSGCGDAACSAAGGCTPGATACVDPGAGACYGSYYDPQEYIFDGGDHDPAVRVRIDRSLTGLQAEDTVVQYVTEDGRELVETGCRTAIYAPRFAAVRKVKRLDGSAGISGAIAAKYDTPIAGVAAPLPALAAAERTVIGRDSQVAVIEGFQDRNRGVPLVLNQTPRGWSDVFSAYEDVELIRTGVATVDDGPLLLRGLAAAQEWGGVEELHVLLDDQQATAVESIDFAQGVHEYTVGPARIRLCKVASQQSANVGDIVDFTIRFDNIAEQTLSDLIISDSLPPRLSYVEGSQQSSIVADFTATPNDVGSQTLKWRLKQPIDPTQGGILRFRARVR